MKTGKAPSWADRLTLIVPQAQLKRLRRGNLAQVQYDGRWYELRPARKLTVTIGKKRMKLSNRTTTKIMRLLKGE